jgi:hypothetical protein
MMRTSDLEGIANEVKAAQDLGKQIELLSARVSGFDNAAAYEVARLIDQARMREGALPVGRKIGFTNRDMWRAYGVEWLSDRREPRLRPHLRRCEPKTAGFLKGRFRAIPMSPINASPSPRNQIVEGSGTGVGPVVK